MVQSPQVDQMSTRGRVEASSPSALGGAASILSSYDDNTLMSRVQDGDKEAFEVLVARHVDRATAVAALYLADDGAGRQAVSEAFLQLWVSRSSYRREGGFRWFLSTLVLDQCRRSTSVGQASSSSGRGATGPSDEGGARRMRDALRHLDRRERELLVMRYGMDLAYQEISNETSLPTSTVRSHVFDSLRKLRGLLEGES